MPGPWWRLGRNREEDKKKLEDWRGDEPWRRKPQEIYKWLRHRWRRSNVMFPHVVAVVVGLTLFILALLKIPGFQHLHP